MENTNIIIYTTNDGKSAVSLSSKDGTLWINQNQLAELFGTSIPNISMHISNIGDRGNYNMFQLLRIT